MSGYVAEIYKIMILPQKLHPHLFKDVRSILTVGLTIGYITLLVLGIVHKEDFFRMAILFLGGGYLLYCQWVIALNYLLLKDGFLEHYPKIPFFLLPKQGQRIDLSDVQSAQAGNFLVLYHRRGQRYMPAIAFTQRNGEQILTTPLPFGRSYEDEEVKSFVRELNREIDQSNSSKKVTASLL